MGSQHSLDRARGRGDRLQEGIALQELGIAYSSKRQYSQALEPLQQALDIFREIDDCHKEAETLSKLGDTYVRLEHYSEALQPLQQALTLLQSTCVARSSPQFSDRTVEVEVLNNLGTADAKLEQYAQAMEYYDQARIIARDLGNSRFVLVPEGTVLSNMGQLLRQQNHIDEAIALYQEAVITWYALRVENEISFSFYGELIADTQILAELLKQQGRTEEAQQVLQLL